MATRCADDQLLLPGFVASLFDLHSFSAMQLLVECGYLFLAPNVQVFGLHQHKRIDPRSSE